MQDRIIAAIGQWQLDAKKDLEEVDLYIEDMFPGKDWQVLLLQFDVSEEEDGLRCDFKGIDIEKVKADSQSFGKYAYRKGSSRGGDITMTTKLGPKFDTKIKTIKENTFKNILKFSDKFPEDATFFDCLKKSFIQNEERIKAELRSIFGGMKKKEVNVTGLSFKIYKDGKEMYLRDFEIIKHAIIQAGSEFKYTHSGIVSLSKNKISSISGKEVETVYGFAAPFKYATPDKPGFISGFFNKKKNWRNYPVGANETLALEIGRKFIKRNLTGYFYGHEYMIVPHPILGVDQKDLKKIISLIQTAIIEEKNVKKERRGKAEDYVLKKIAEEKNYFTLDLMFFKEDKKTQAITIELMIEEVLPSRFRTLFIDVPQKVNAKKIFKNAITIKREKQDLKFSYQLIKDFFDDKFLDAVNKLFPGQKFDKNFVFQKIMHRIRQKYNDAKTSDGFVEPIYWLVLKALMLLDYLQQLNLIPYDKNYTFMEPNIISSSSRFDREKFFEFVKENPGFLDSDLKIGLFALGILVRFLFDLQQANLENTPFENKLHGYKLNPELLERIYTEALDKIQKYTGFYAYGDLREIIAKYFVPHVHEMKRLSNSELSFYFVAGLELGNQFKRPSEENNNKKK